MASLDRRSYLHLLGRGQAAAADSVFPHRLRVLVVCVHASLSLDLWRNIRLPEFCLQHVPVDLGGHPFPAAGNSGSFAVLLRAAHLQAKKSRRIPLLSMV